MSSAPSAVASSPSGARLAARSTQAAAGAQAAREMAPYQDGVTIMTAIKRGRIAQLEELLRAIGSDIEGNALIPFPRLKTVHFARFVVLEESRDAEGRPTPESLIFSSNFDGGEREHIEELYDQASAGLHVIYEHCEGYPPPDKRSKAAVVRYFLDHNIGYNTLYIGTRGRPVQQIKDEAILRERIEEFLDGATRNPDFVKLEPGQIRTEIQRFVQGREDLSWALKPPPTMRRFWPTRREIRPAITVAAILLGAIALLIKLPGWSKLLVPLIPLGLLGYWVITLRRREKTDEQFPIVTDFEHVARIAQQEDRFVQNQMSAVNNIKPGAFRLFTLRTVLMAIDISTRFIYTKGTLGSIPSIHFGRWVIIDGGRRLAFFSNFDGSWENYLGDFIDKAAGGLTAVWSNTYGFPRSRFLLGEGARDEQRFKAFGRNSQVVTQVWYTAYKWLSVQNINNNSAIRAGLFGPQTPEETAAWLRRL